VSECVCVCESGCVCVCLCMRSAATFYSSSNVQFLIMLTCDCVRWDETYAYPVTYSYLKAMGVYPAVIIVLLCPFALVVGWSFFMIGSMLLFTFTEFKDVFQWEC
jgi:hypothetical protein